MTPLEILAPLIGTALLGVAWYATGRLWPEEDGAARLERMRAARLACLASLPVHPSACPVWEMPTSKQRRRHPVAID